MKEIPILFSAPMMRANLAGVKDVTRRIVKLRDRTGTYSTFDDDGWPCSADECGDWHRDPCRYGEAGDVLWARETWRPVVSKTGVTRGIQYLADLAMRLTEDIHDPLFIAASKAIPLELWEDGMRGDGAAFNANKDRWRPSIHMPRAACRFEATIVSVRVERLHEITEEDAIREGLVCSPACSIPGFESGPRYASGTDVDHKYGWCPTARMAYAFLWDSINGEGSWSRNPWVYRIEYKNPHKEYRNGQP